jgi:hypothetical protein
MMFSEGRKYQSIQGITTLNFYWSLIVCIINRLISSEHHVLFESKFLFYVRTERSENEVQQAINTLI